MLRMFETQSDEVSEDLVLCSGATEQAAILLSCMTSPRSRDRNLQTQIQIPYSGTT